MARVYDSKVVIKIYWRRGDEIVWEDEANWWDEKREEIKSAGYLSR